MSRQFWIADAASGHAATGRERCDHGGPRRSTRRYHGLSGHASLLASPPLLLVPRAPIHRSRPLLELRFDLRLETGRTDAVAEPRVRVARDVALEREPVVLLIVDSPSVAADPQDVAQHLHFSHGGLELGHQTFARGLGFLAVGDVA